jgi:DNA topoisomerase-2
MSSLEKYQKKDLETHIYDTPDTYVGGSDMIEDTLPILQDDGTIRAELFEYVPALYNTFNEILVNARDQHVRLKQMKGKSPVNNIKIQINKDEGFISIYNDGEGIDIAEHPTEKNKDGKPIMIPEMIFGHLLTSTNYEKDEKKIVGGKNGYGAKLTNIFSIIFTLETVDPVRKLKYTQEFKNNMKSKGKPKITKYTQKPYTKVSWVADFERFGITGYSDKMYQLIERRLYDIAGVTDKSLNVFYNDSMIKQKTFDKYIGLYLKDEKLVYEEIHQRWSIGVALSTTDKFEQVSFVNGIATPKGGKHVDSITKQIVQLLTTHIEKKEKTKVKENYIKNYLKIFINSTIENPSFDSQTKERLITSPAKFGSKPVINDKFIKKILTLGIVDKVISFAEFKENKQAKKTDGAKKNKIQVPKLDDANWAGTKKSEECVLILTEGDSAKTMAVSGLSVVGRDKYGVFPLRGKLLNVRDASIKQITDNAEITNLKKIIGLETGKEYKDTKKLRYGKVMIMTDQDHDGSHIKGLVLNMFHTMWPSLLKLNFITSMITPIVKVTKGKKVKSFFNLTDYYDWTQKTSGYKSWKTKYYKGLGTSNTSEAKDYFKDMKMNNYLWSDLTNESMSLAFNKKEADKRKDWLYNYDEKIILDSKETEIPMDNFINRELIHFSNSDTKRSIGSLYDGLKPSQRKILYSCFKRKLYSEIRVAQLAGYVSENAAYHHGEASLQGAIIGMAQNFVGSNNINLLEPNGQFGTRIMGGSDAASSRYIHTELNKLTQSIYPKEDFPLLDYIEDDGLKVEPEYYVPIIPMVLVNGMTGIGTGFSTSIPCFNPTNICNNIKNILSDKEFVEMEPWFGGFEGSISKTSEKTFLCKGSYKVLDSTTIEITELPVGRWTEDYKEILNKLVIERGSKADGGSKGDNKKIIVDYENHSTDSTVYFKVYLKPGYLSTAQWSDGEIDKVEKDFKLTTTKHTSLTNIHLYNENNTVTRYNDVETIMREFCKARLDLYKKRKEYQLSELDKQIQLISSKCKFIQEVVEGTIVISKQTKEKILFQLVDKDYPEINESYDYLLKLPLYTLTKEEIDKLLKEKDNLIKQHEDISALSAKVMWLNELDIFKKEYSKFLKNKI